MKLSHDYKVINAGVQYRSLMVTQVFNLIIS